MGTDLETRRSRRTGSRPRWTPLVLGVAAVLAVPVVRRLLRMLWRPVASGTGGGFPSPSQLAVATAIVLGAAGLLVGVRALRHGERSWPVWAGTILSALVAAAWLVFALGEVLLPH